MVQTQKPCLQAQKKSRMKLKYAFLTLILIFITCKSSKLNQKLNEIIEIGESRTCEDKGGKFHSTKIRKDSTIAISGTRVNSDTLKYATDKNQWKKLSKLLNKKDFIKLTVGKNVGQLSSDGCINFIYIKTIDSTINRTGYNVNFKIIDKVNSIEELME